MKPSTIGIAGFGTMGRALTILFLRKGWKVIVWNRQPSRFEDIGSVLTQFKESRQLTLTTSLKDLLPADFILETIVEKLLEKRALFEKLDGLMPSKTLFMSNTSSLSIGSLASATRRPERVIGLHFVNPPQFIPIVEVIAHPLLSQQTLETTLELARQLGKHHVVSADSPGFIINRVLMPLINEAGYVAGEKLGDPARIDFIARSAFNWPMGPLAMADFVGLDVCLDIITYLHEQGVCRAPNDLLKNLVRTGCLGRKTGCGFHEYRTKSVKGKP